MREIIHTVRKYVFLKANFVWFSQKVADHLYGIIIDPHNPWKCEPFNKFEHLISVYNGKRGLHLVVPCIWSWDDGVYLGAVFEGQDTTSPKQLGSLSGRTPKKQLTKHFQLMILRYCLWSGCTWYAMKYHAIAAGVYYDLSTAWWAWFGVFTQTVSVRLVDLKFLFRYLGIYLKRMMKQKFGLVLSTKPSRLATILLLVG